MKVLITGGTGFIGSRLALRCAENGDSVTVLGQENTAAEASNKNLIETAGVKVLLVAVTDRVEVFKASQGADLVYHLAAAQHEANVPDQHFRDVNVTGTENVLDASVDAGVKRFVHGSTIGVYGSALDGTLDEESPVGPDNIYGVTKLEGERLALSYLDRMPVAVIRISETYGPGDWRLLKLFRAIKKRRFLIIGKGQNLHHPIYVDDLIDGFHLAASKEEAIGQVFVLSGAEQVTTTEMAETVARQLGTSIPGFRVPLPPLLLVATVMGTTLGSVGIQSPLHPRRMDFFRKSFVFSQEKVSKVLQFTPKVGFEQGVENTAGWYTDMGYL